MTATATAYYPKWRNESKPCRDVSVTWSETPCEIDVGEGYRRLELGEVLRESDELMWAGGKWLKTRQPDEAVLYGHYVYRRKIEKPAKPVDVGNGYRLLVANEIILDGDESFHGGFWFETHREGNTVSSDDVFRRKIEKPTYTFVEVGEVMQEGDEYFLNVDCKWIPVESGYFGVPVRFGCVVIRRRAT